MSSRLRGSTAFPLLLATSSRATSSETRATRKRVRPGWRSPAFRVTSSAVRGEFAWWWGSGGRGQGGEGGGGSFGIYLDNATGASVRDSSVSAADGGSGGARGYAGAGGLEAPLASAAAHRAAARPTPAPRVVEVASAARAASVGAAEGAPEGPASRSTACSPQQRLEPPSLTARPGPVHRVTAARVPTVWRPATDEPAPRCCACAGRRRGDRACRMWLVLVQVAERDV